MLVTKWVNTVIAHRDASSVNERGQVNFHGTKSYNYVRFKSRLSSPRVEEEIAQWIPDVALWISFQISPKIQNPQKFSIFGIFSGLVHFPPNQSHVH